MSAIPTEFSGTVSGEIRLNGDIFISAANGNPGQFIEIPFTVIDNRGAITFSSQTITLADFQDDYLPGDAATNFGSIAVDTTEIGFIEMDDDAISGTIQALDGKEMGGRALRVNEAQDKPRGGGGGGGGGGGYGGGRGGGGGGDRW